METVPDDQLPVKLPEDVDFKSTGQSPLIYYEPFLKTVDSDGNPAERETDTMDTFMCSSWYQYRYLSPKYDKAPFDPEEAAYWLPVDTYTGGAEHATMHLLYTRWFAKAMRDLGIFDDAAAIMREHGRDPEGVFDEPMKLLRNQGQVLGGERPGDIVLASGRFEGNKLYADRVEVINRPSDTPKGFDGVVGEIVKRTENLLTINMAGVNRVVEVVKGATIIIPAIPGDNDVNQLRHHLEIQRMSKSKGNVVNPDELVTEYGADSVRAYMMFNFDWEKGGPWNENNIKGPAGWIRDVWDIVHIGAPSSAGDPDVNRDIERKLHQTIDAVEHSLENFSFNTAISSQMKFKNFLTDALKAGTVGAAAWENAINVMLRLMAPITPHVAEELWAQMGYPYSVHQQDWPQYDAEKAAEDAVELVVMINGKPRDKVIASADIEQDDAIAMALETDGAKRALNGGKAKKVIFIPGRKGQEPKVNIVV
jgi:leucyl-tRNA synthetase